MKFKNKEELLEAMKKSFTERGLERWIDHTFDVLKCAEAILKVIEADKDTVQVAAIFHDIGKGNKDHEESGGIITKEILAEIDLNQKLKDDTVAIVNVHHCGRGLDSPEFHVVWIADHIHKAYPDDKEELSNVVDRYLKKLVERRMRDKEIIKSRKA